MGYKQERLVEIAQSLKDYAQAESSALYSLNLNLKYKAYGDLYLCAKRLLDISLKVEDLLIEQKSILEAIEDEAKEDLL